MKVPTVNHRMTCRICGNPDANRTCDVREMMFGTRKVFTYFQCAHCRCLQIAEIPHDLSAYYPSNYYNVNIDPASLFRGNVVHKLVKRLRDRYAVLGKGATGRLLYAFVPNASLRKLSRIPLTLQSRILDVGCGSGTLLYTLRMAGFANLLGIDAHIDSAIVYDNGLKIEKKTLAEVDGKWDMVMFNHALECLPDQRGTLSRVSELLEEGGWCVLGLPTVSSYAWDHYGTNWVQIDAPRRLYLHSVESLTLLAEKSGFIVSDVLCDSDEMQFWGSEQYAKDIPLRSERSWSEAPAKSIFTPEDIAEFREHAKRLNREGRGDQAVFYLKKK